MTFLDTNFLIFALSRGTPEDQTLRALLNAQESVNISTIVWAEFLCGPVSRQHTDLAQTMFVAPEPFVAEDAIRAAELFNGTGRRRGSLTDCMIAAVCLRHRAAIATKNENDFLRFAQWGLRILPPNNP